MTKLHFVSTSHSPLSIFRISPRQVSHSLIFGLKLNVSRKNFRLKKKHTVFELFDWLNMQTHVNHVHIINNEKKKNKKLIKVGM